MSKVPLQNVTNLQTSSAVTTINNNSSTITTAFDNTLSRDGTTPNQMGANLDMNSNRVINLPAAIGGTEPVRLAEFNNVVFGTSSGISNIGALPAHTIPIATGTSTLHSIQLTGGQLLVGATGADPTAQTVSGDGTLTAAGVLTVTKTSGTSFAPSATTDTTSATNITSGTLPAARLPALTGDVTSTVNTATTAVAAIRGNTVSGTSGSGNVVFSTSPSLTTPTLGVATATTVNKVTITPPPTGSTLTINDGKTLSVGNTVTLTAGADGTTQTFPAVSGTLFNSGSPITNINLATMPANTIKGNVTGSSAIPTDFTIDGLTLKGSPAGADEVVIWDVAGTAIKKATVASIGSSSGVAAIDGRTGSFTTGNGIDTTGGNMFELTPARRTLPTTQVFTTGSGTYTTPNNCLWIEVMLVGGGAGGGGGNGGIGSAGGNTTFGTSLLAANGGAATNPAYFPGAPGTASGGYLNIAGGRGSSGMFNCVVGASTQGAPGGNGGSSSLGGAGGGVYNAAGFAAAANSGSGGGGGGVGAAAQETTGGGGSSGGTCLAIINTPAATYPYTVGAAGSGGTAGTDGQTGANGAQGIIRVIEHYGT